MRPVFDYYNRMGQAIPNRELNLLRSYPNVIVSPHTAFYTDVNVASMVQSPLRRWTPMPTASPTPVRCSCDASR